MGGNFEIPSNSARSIQKHPKKGKHNSIVNFWVSEHTALIKSSQIVRSWPKACVNSVKRDLINGKR